MQSRQVSSATHLRGRKIRWLVATRIGMGEKENDWLRHRPHFPRRRKRKLGRGTGEEENQSRAPTPRASSPGLRLGAGQPGAKRGRLSLRGARTSEGFTIYGRQQP